MTRQPNEIMIPLHILDNLFEESEHDFFAEHPINSSGIDYLLNALRPRQLRGDVYATFLLPSDQITAATETQVLAAIQRYCRYQLDIIATRNVALRWQGIKAVQTGVSFLAICLAISFFFRDWTVLPDFLRNVLSEGFLITGWVSIWRPSEIFLYEWWPDWRTQRIYDYILHLKISVRGK